jgi:hypothetical protein
MLPPEGNHPLTPVCTVLGRHSDSAHTECVRSQERSSGRFAYGALLHSSHQRRGSRLSSLTNFLSIPGFRNALKALMALQAKRPEEAATLRNFELPDDPSLEVTLASRAFTTLYQMARQEGVEPLLRDIADADLGSPDELRSLGELLAEDSDATLRLQAVKLLDGFMPILQSAQLSLDLRVLDLAEGRKLLPYVTVRLQFDEDVNGNSSTVFQLPVAALDELTLDLDNMRGRLSALRGDMTDSSIPAWVWR